MELSSHIYSFSPLQQERQKFTPTIPETLNSLLCTKRHTEIPISQDIKDLFPVLTSSPMPLVEFLPTKGSDLVDFPKAPVKIGVVLSGGQAPGGHNVIAGIYDFAKKINPQSEVHGFLMGPHGIMNGRSRLITPQYMELFRNQGGFDMICAGRDKIEKPEQFANSLKVAQQMELDGIVVIGGDDSNTNACLLGEYFAKHESKCKVIGAPKTIDGDLMNQYIPCSFGFHTATRTFAELIGNICLDTISSKKYYHFIRLMGRSASHIALECALLTRPNVTFIGQEVAAKKLSMKDITNSLADIICARSQDGKDFGIVLVPEGLIEFIPEINLLISAINTEFGKHEEHLNTLKSIDEIRDFTLSKLSANLVDTFNFLPHTIAEQLLLDRDSHGNVQVSKIDTEKLLILLVQTELAERQTKGTYNGDFVAQSHFFGYEGRCGLPSVFDSEYCYSIGHAAGALISLGYSGYMATVQKIASNVPSSQWVASGSPLPIMMHMEKRKGKNVPVIKKALVELDGPVFKAFEAVRDIWAVRDCYQPQGPIQFSGLSTDLPFVIEPPKPEVLHAEAKEVEEVEIVFQKNKNPKLFVPKAGVHLSQLGRRRMKEDAPIPQFLETGNYRLHVVKKQQFSQNSEYGLSAKKGLGQIIRNPRAKCFVSVIRENTSGDLDGPYIGADPEVEGLRQDLKAQALLGQPTSQNPCRIGIVFNGRQAPGGNNIIDGLLRFAENSEHSAGAVEIIGFTNGTKGFLEGRHVKITKDMFQYFKNQGGYDSLGRTTESIRSVEHLRQAAEVCERLNLHGIVLVGATHILSDGLYLSNFFLKEKLKTGVIVVPATVDGNIRHNGLIEAAIGFDTSSKIYAQLVGNIMTDAASAIKYWYFIRLMGRDPSHLVLETGLTTHPNHVVISEDAVSKGQTLQNIVSTIADLVVKRQAAGKNFGTVIIPEGLLAHLPHYKHLLEELNSIFAAHVDEDSRERVKFALNLYNNPEELQKRLSPWSYVVFQMLPDFIQKQMLLEREVHGSVQLSQIETERLLAYLVKEELKKRANYDIKKFSSVTHFFGYQGRCAFPSRYDCSLASTSGFAAGYLLKQGMTGMVVTVHGSMEADVNKWRVGGVPIIAMTQPRVDSYYGPNYLVVRSEEVQLDKEPYQRLTMMKKEWELIDHYENPGPIQFYNTVVKDSVTQTLIEYERKRNLLQKKMRRVLAILTEETTFTEDSGALEAALSTLHATQKVLQN